MPWPNLTPQEIAAYQMMGNPQMGQAQGMTPQMMAYLQNMANAQNPQMGAMQNPAMGIGMNNALTNPTVRAMLMSPQTMPGGGVGNMSTLLNNPQLLQLLMAQRGFGGTP